jgi:hypothetical protein
MRKLTIALLIVGVAAAAQAATINYKMLVNGRDVSEVSAGTAGVQPGVPFALSIQVNTPDDWVDSLQEYGGVIQADFSLADSTGTPGSLLPELKPSSPPFPLGHREWNSTTNSPWMHYRGWLNTGRDALYDVYQECDYLTGDMIADYHASFGAGPGVWSTVVQGDFTWDGTPATLTLQPFSLSGQLVFTYESETQRYTAIYPTAANGDVITFMPEPATLSLLAMGALAALRRRATR